MTHIEELGKMAQAAGLVISRLEQFTEPHSPRVWTRYIALRDDGSRVRFAVVDFPGGDYALMIETPSRAAAEDVAAIQEARAS